MWDAKFHHVKAFESSMVEEFETNSCIATYIIFMKIVGYPSLRNGWNAEENWETQETAMLQLYAKDMK